MKPVPFAQFIERRQLRAPSSAAEKIEWPVRRSQTLEERLAERQSPLLRPVEKPRPQSHPQDWRREDPPMHDAQRHEGQRVDQGHLRAFEEGRAAARKELEDERAGLHDDLAAEVAAERARWVEEESGRLAEAHRAAIESFESRCAQAVVNILRPFLTQAVIGRVTEALVANLDILLSARNQDLFEISGPADLLEALRGKLGDRDAAIVFKPDEGIDVRVIAGDSVIETQLEAWMEALGALPRGSADE